MTKEELLNKLSVIHQTQKKVSDALYALGALDPDEDPIDWDDYYQISRLLTKSDSIIDKVAEIADGVEYFVPYEDYNE